MAKKRKSPKGKLILLGAIGFAAASLFVSLSGFDGAIVKAQANASARQSAPPSQKADNQADHCQGFSPFANSSPYAHLASGFNLPNWSPDHQGLKPDKALLSYLQGEGFTHIRLPADGAYLMAALTSATGITKFLDALSQAVEHYTAQGFTVSVDMHPGSSFQKIHAARPEEGYAMLIEAWDRILARSANWSNQQVYFELLNEPVPSQSIWWAQAQRLVDHIRARQPDRVLIVGPAVFQRYEPLLAATPLKGDKIIYAFHYYDPFLFTHQAMTWDQGSYMSQIAGLPFPAKIDHPAIRHHLRLFADKGNKDAVEAFKSTYKDPWDAARIAKDFAKVGDWARKHAKPVIVNEFGVLNFDVDQHARTDWLRAVRIAAEAQCIGWTHWDFSDGFGMVDPKTTLPDALVIDALTGKQ